jgi:hypothetical protein
VLLRKKEHRCQAPVNQITERSECNLGKRFLIKKFHVDCSLQFHITEIFPRVRKIQRSSSLKFSCGSKLRVEFKIFSLL